MSHEHDRVLILDFGSQFTQLIARRIRDGALVLISPQRYLGYLAWPALVA